MKHADTMRMFAQKHTARELAEKAEVPVLAGSPLLSSDEEALEYAKQVGLPVLLKATGTAAQTSRMKCQSHASCLFATLHYSVPPNPPTPAAWRLPAGGGGGIGIHICRTEEEVVTNYASASRQGAAAFGDAGVFVEKYVQRARHIEVQIFGDGKGNVVTFPERECSIQVGSRQPPSHSKCVLCGES